MFLVNFLVFRFLSAGFENRKFYFPGHIDYTEFLAATLDRPLGGIFFFTCQHHQLPSTNPFLLRNWKLLDTGKSTSQKMCAGPPSESSTRMAVAPSRATNWRRC